MNKWKKILLVIVGIIAIAVIGVYLYLFFTRY